MSHDWMFCDGNGGLDGHQKTSRMGISNGTTPQIAISRRNLLVGAGMGALLWAMKSPALAQLAFDPKRKRPNVLVNIFLRGGMDGLNAVVPYGDPDYHRARPSLGLGTPQDSTKTPADRVVDLDGFFGLHPELSPLLPLYREGRLALVHAAGSGDETRSHFEAMATMEHGMSAEATGTASGWLARHLQTTAADINTPLRAVAFTSVMPDSLRGATNATALESLADFRLASESEQSVRFQVALHELYGSGNDAMSQAGRETLDVLKTLRTVEPGSYRPANGAKYPNSDLGKGLQQVAFLIKAGVGLEVAFLDKGGWDTHVAQSQLFSGQVQDLGVSLAAFAQDLGAEMSNVTTVVQTEFGRRVQENTGLGTDHGHGSVMFLLGGGVQGGRVHGRWPGLKVDSLDGPGDLQVTTDYRLVLAETLRNRLGNGRISEVFPSLQTAELGIVTA